MKFLPLLILILILSFSAFGQNRSVPNLDYAARLIGEVLRQAEDNNDHLYRDYQYSYKNTAISEKTGTKKSWSYEFYCRADGRSYCRAVPVGENDKMFSIKKINKAREQAAKALGVDTPQLNRKYDYGYGTTFGYGIKGQNFWVDQALYLKLCKLTDSAETIIGGRKMVQVEVTNCVVEGEPRIEKISFMSQTRARLWLDEEDKAVTKIEIYPVSQPIESLEKPIVIIEFARTDDGIWLHKSGRLSTKNKSIFPFGVDDFEVEYFNYQKLNVNVEAEETKAN